MNIMKFCDKCGLKLDSEAMDCPNCLNNSLMDNSSDSSFANKNTNDSQSLIKDTLIGTEFLSKNFKSSKPEKYKESSDGSDINTRTARLVVEKGGTDGREFPIYKDVSNIGRWDPNLDSHPEVDLSDEDIKAKVSRVHARIFRKKEGFYVEDMGSRNGSYLNREYKLVKNVEYSLKDNDEIIIGHLFLRFKID